MNEEEKKAVQDSKNIINELNNHKDKDFIGRMYYKNKPIEEILAILLKLIEKLRERLKLMDDYNNWVQVAIDRGIELEKLQKENGELKNNKTLVEKILDKGKGFTLQQTQYIWEHYIPVQKIKDKIEELENAYWYCENVKNQTIEALEELLEESEEIYE